MKPKNRFIYPFISDIKKLLILIIFVTCFSYIVISNDFLPRGFWNTLEPIIGLTTLFVAIFVWYNEKIEERENNLPKKLDVSFFFRGKLIFRCEKANLMGESDIRALGQQIGSQMAGVRFLGFAVPGIRTPEHKEEYIIDKSGKKQYYIHYFAEFDFTDINNLPEDIKNEIQDLVNNGKYKLWIEPFIDKEGKRKIKIKYI